VKAQDISYRVLFDFDRYEIPDTALVALVRLIHQFPAKQIRIEGHCDSSGNRLYNKQLSERRAAAVKKLLTDNTIPVHQIKTCIGYGKDRFQPEESDLLNRRVWVYFEGVEQETPKTAVQQIVRKEEPHESKKFSEQQSADWNSGQQIELDQLHFLGGRHILTEESLPVVVELCRVLLKNPKLQIEIQGHVCCTTVEPDGFDLDEGTENLSFTRARAIFEYLRHCGIAAERMRYKGLGGSHKKVYPELSETDRRQNRRVEIRVL